MPDNKKYDRRKFLETAVISIAAAQLPLLSFANTIPEMTNIRPAEPSKLISHSFEPTRQINAGVLNVGYVDEGPAEAPPVILLHGWPYDIHSFAEVTPLLLHAGYRVIIPYLRGYGSTRFLSAETMRN